MRQNSSKHISDLHPDSWEGAQAFPSRIAPISRTMLGWLPDEYMFSLVARNHTYWGHRTAAETIELLFGTRGDRADWQEMDAIEIFVAKTEGRLGGPLEVFENHTLLRFYQVFMRPQERARYFSARKNFSEQMKFPMALWNGSFTKNHPLRACASCIAEDEADFGMSYWHLQHQYPGVFICLKHEAVLQNSAVISSSMQRFLFHSPVVASLLPSSAEVHKQSEKDFMVAALLIQNLTADMQKGVAALASFRERFIAFVKVESLVSPAGALALLDKPAVQALCENFVLTTKQLALVEEYKAISKSAYSVHHTLSSYIRGTRAIYVMEQIALIFWFRTLPFWTEHDEMEWIT